MITYKKSTRNPFRIRTSKTKDLKPFRMNTYKKKGRGEGRTWGWYGPGASLTEQTGGIPDRADLEHPWHFLPAAPNGRSDFLVY
jgi:hypothetical protein